MNGFTTASAVAAITSFALTAGGGTALVAEASVPGDALYGVKRSVNEPIKESLAFSTTAQADIEADLALRRLDELQTLAEQTRLDDDTRTELSAEFSAHAKAAQELAVDAAENGNGEAAVGVMAEFAADLGEEAALLNADHDYDGGPWLDMDATVDVISDVRADVLGTQASISLQQHSDAQTSAEETDSEGMSVESGMLKRAALHL